MKKSICTFFLLFVGMLTLTFAETRKAINERNEYTGKTIEVTFSPGDKEYEKGYSKEIDYYEGNEKRVKRESFYTNEYTRSKGVLRSIDYFDGNGKVFKIENFNVSEYTKNGVSKDIFYYESNKLVKVEIYFAKEQSRKNGVLKYIAHFDGIEKRLKASCYDTNEKVVQCPKQY